MHIIAILIAIVTVIGVWQWRVQRARQIADELGEVAATAANLPRRLAFKRKSGKRGLSLIEEPREAAAVMLYQMAKEGGDVTAAAKEVMRELMVDEFEITDEDADALTHHAGWLLREGPVADAVMARMTQTILASPAIGPKEIVDLDGMLVAVSEADGPPTHDQLQLLQTYRNRAGVRT
ncbi:MAG: hypothetical protein GVY13_16945 [Alphaproteobacteria bacterium]|jgi:uncharacterized tellurite resistance protein B-like protein|nr:hypothetical protein [Alphaproteobacteria bacterium]